jgi:hypothetical protein
VGKGGGAVNFPDRSLRRAAGVTARGRPGALLYELALGGVLYLPGTAAKQTRPNQTDTEEQEGGQAARTHPPEMLGAHDVTAPKSK